METKWLEDFISLAETRSFSRSAQLRHVTQPAFSRRIQALEAWAGTDLVDRSSHPTQLTPAGQALYAQALEMLQGLQATRAMLRGQSAAAQDLIEFAVPHTLALSFFPTWLSGLRERLPSLKCRVAALNVHDALLRLIEGSSDLLIAHHHEAQPLALDPQRFDMLELGQDHLAPYTVPAADGSPLFAWPGQAAQPLPYLGYAPGAYLGSVVDLLLSQSGAGLHLERLHEADMAEGLKAMALEGQGLAFLPHSAVQQELAQGRLVPAGPGPQALLPLRLYREKPVGKRSSKSAAQALWAHLNEAAG